MKAVPQDEPFFFNSGGRQLFAIWQPAVAARAALLYCHPFGEEKKSAHRAVVETLRALATDGLASLRFDMTGCGDSEGEFAEASLPLWLDDLVNAWDELERRCGGVPRILLGLRLGAALAALASARLHGVQSLIMWQPVIQGKEEFDADLRRLLVQQMITSGQATGRESFRAAMERGELELDGYPVSVKLYESLGTIDLWKERDRLVRLATIIQFGRTTARIQSFAEAAPRIPSLVVEMPPFWARTEFIPDAGTGRTLAESGITRWLKLA